MSFSQFKTSTRFAVLVNLLFILSVILTSAQENAQYRISPALMECYDTEYFMNLENRLPMNIETLITLIEKVENSPDFKQDMRQLAVSLLYRFRQDGIERTTNVAGIKSYNPSGSQFPKFRILISRLISGNAYQFPNSSLTLEERCSLHFMLSNSIDKSNENIVCNKFSQNIRNDINDDTINNKFSPCPIENGVIWTPWGTVTAGTVIAGIAAGLQQQTVQLRTLLALARHPVGPNIPQTAALNIDNRFAATLAGGLAEVALLQLPTSAINSVNVGVNGTWNSVVLPKWYILSDNQNLEMTDAEIRGGIDGLNLAINIAEWHKQMPNLKLSQLLRMYYPPHGSLDSEIMAGTRNDIFKTISIDTMIAQTSAFAQLLDREKQTRVNLSPNVIKQFSNYASNALYNYICGKDF